MADFTAQFPNDRCSPRGIPRGGLWAALRKSLASSPNTYSLRDHRCPDLLIVHEELFGEGRAGFPEDLFGPDFRWEPLSGVELAFLDLETCGLANEPIFLIGILKPQDSRLWLWRLLTACVISVPG